MRTGGRSSIAEGRESSMAPGTFVEGCALQPGEVQLKQEGEAFGEMMTGKEPGGGGKAPRRGARKHDWITNQLRRVYDEALQEEIPADMLELLAKLDAKPEKESDS